MENRSAFSSQGITYCCSVRCIQLLRDRPLVLLVPWCTGCSIIRNREVSNVFGRVKKFGSVGWRSGSGPNLNWFLLYAHFVSLISDDWLDFFSLRPEAHRPQQSCDNHRSLGKNVYSPTGLRVITGRSIYGAEPKKKQKNTRHLLTKWQWTLCKLLFWRFLVCIPFFSKIHYGSASCWGVFADKSASFVHIC